jgi:hypothetical protein
MLETADFPLFFLPFAEGAGRLALDAEAEFGLKPWFYISSHALWKSRETS